MTRFDELLIDRNEQITVLKDFTNAIHKDGPVPLELLKSFQEVTEKDFEGLFGVSENEARAKGEILLSAPTVQKLRKIISDSGAAICTTHDWHYN